MICARLNGDTLTVSGHAGYAPAGQDIVCAAVSTTVALCEAALAAFGCPWQEQDDGTAVTVTAAGPAAAAVLHAALAVLRQLAAQYPDHVHIL